MTVYDITAELTAAEVYPGDPVTKVTRVRRIKSGDGCNLTAVSMCTHAGTHLEAPLHFIDSGLSVNELDLALFIGECSVVACNGFCDDITGADIERLVQKGTRKVLFKTVGRCRLTRSAAFALVNIGVELVGIDAISIAPEDDEESVHRELMSAGIAVLEGLVLRHVRSGSYTLVALPMKIDGVEAAPCRAILLKN